MPEISQPAPGWNEETTRLFLDYGRYFVPDREEQAQIICELIPAVDEPFHVLDLCCGEGLLSGAILERYPHALVHALDGSPEMLSRARQNLAGYGERFNARPFSLQDESWRKPGSPLHGMPEPARAIVSSLAIHHLTGQEKGRLYRDLFGLLAPGGALLIADMIDPPDPHWREMTARLLDDAILRRAQALDGSREAYEFFEKEHWNIYRYPDEMDKPSPIFDHLQWLSAAGFTHVDVIWVKAGHAIYGGVRPPA